MYAYRKKRLRSSRRFFHRGKAKIKLFRGGGAGCSVLPDQADAAWGYPNHLVEIPLPVPELGTKKMVPIRKPWVRKDLPTECLKGLGTDVGLPVSCDQIVLIGRTTVRR